MANASDRCSEALQGVSSVLQDITQDLQNAQSQVKYWKIEADAWKARYEQERARNERLRRVLRCTSTRDSLTAQPSLTVSPRGHVPTAAAQYFQRHPSLLQRGSGMGSGRYSCDDSNSSFRDRQEQLECEFSREDGAAGVQSRPAASQLKCLVEEPENLTPSSNKQLEEPTAADDGPFLKQQQQQQVDEQNESQDRASSRAARHPSKSHDGYFAQSAADNEGAAASHGAAASAAAATHGVPDPFACCSQSAILDNAAAKQEDSSPGGFAPVTSARAGAAADGHAVLQLSSTVELQEQHQQEQAGSIRQTTLRSMRALGVEGALASLHQQQQQQQDQQDQQQQHPPPVRRARTLPRSFGYGSSSGGGTRSAGWQSGQWGSSFSGTGSGALGSLQQQHQHKHTVDQLLRMMMAFTIMQGGGTGTPGEADGVQGTEGAGEEEPLPTVSLDDDDGSSGVGLAAAAAVSAAMARAWASAASKEQRAVAAAAAAAGGTGAGAGEAGSGTSQRAGFRLVATVTNKMGKREKSGAALSSIYSQESMETGSSSDLIGMARSNSGSSSPSMVSSTGPAAPGAIARKLSGGSADAAEQPGSAVNGPSSSSSGKPPLAPTTQGSGEGSSSSTSRLAAASSPGDDSSDGAGGTTAAAAAAARSASGGAPNTGQATAISLHWLSKPRTVLVMRKLAPSTEAAFLQALEWLRRHHITIYVEPKVYQGLLDTGRVLPAPQLRGSSSGSCLAGMLVNTGAASSDASSAAAGGPAGKAGAAGGSLTAANSWPGHSRYSGSSSGVAAAASAPAGPGPASVVGPQGSGLVKTWQPEVTIDQQQGNCSTEIVSDLIPECVAQQLDLVVVLGGDGTVLWTCHIFGNRSVPPLVPFNLGSLGFLTPFDPARLEQVLHRTVKGGFPITLRHRLHCTIVRGASCAANCSQQAASDFLPAVSHSCLGKSVYGEEHVALNEVVIERGISPFLTNLECFCDGAFVTHVQGDGLIIGTPTGSTAYSLAAGGSMVHPQVPCILFTPICPHSLSFRPLMFPDYCQLCIQVPTDSRGHVWASFDGKDRIELVPGDAVVVRLSKWPVPSVAAEADPSGDWFSAVRECLHWNMRKVQGGAGA